MRLGHVDSQKSISSSTEQQSREILLSGAAGLMLGSNPHPTNTPTTTETQEISAEQGGHHNNIHFMYNNELDQRGRVFIY